MKMSSSEHGKNMLCTKIVLNVRNNLSTQHILPRFELGIFMYRTCMSMNNLSSYCGLVDAKIRASDKDLPVFSVVVATSHNISTDIPSNSGFWFSSHFACQSVTSTPVLHRLNLVCSFKRNGFCK